MSSDKIIMHYLTCAQFLLLNHICTLGLVNGDVQFVDLHVVSFEMIGSCQSLATHVTNMSLDSFMNHINVVPQITILAKDFLTIFTWRRSDEVMNFSDVASQRLRVDEMLSTLDTQVISSFFMHTLDLKSKGECLNFFCFYMFYG